MPRVRVRLFAILRERAGRDAIELELTDGATVADALGALRRIAGVGELIDPLQVVMAVNREYAHAATSLHEHDELVLIPPVSGGAGDVHARVTDRPLSAGTLARMVSRPAAGALVTFQGTTRDVAALDYEVYREMAEPQMRDILSACVARHGLEAAAAEHRVGQVALGEPGVVICVSAAHRGEAFAGARDAIDAIKARVPVWKREVRGDGEGAWVPGTPVKVPDEPRLTHLDRDGRARMVDVGDKPVTERRAVAEAVVHMSVTTAEAILRGDGPKGDVVTTARIAAIQGAKRTAELIPLAHPVALAVVDVRIEVDAPAGRVRVEGEARTRGQTGVELEAMMACSVAALTVYDMVKGIERGVTVGGIRLLAKSGGAHDWRRRED